MKALSSGLIIKTIVAAALFMQLGLCALSHYSWRNDNEVATDNKSYACYTFNLMSAGVFSHETESPPAASMRRAPAYPVYLAMVMSLVPGLRGQSINDIFIVDGEMMYFRRKADMIPFFINSLVLIIALAALSAGVVWKLCESRYYTVAAFLFVLLEPSWHRHLHPTAFFRNDLFATLLFTIFSLLLYKAVNRPRFLPFLVAGMFLGLLALTRAVFLYFLPPLLVFIFIQMLLVRIPIKRNITITLFFLAGCCIVVMPWMFRNARLFDYMKIRTGGGTVLGIRANYNMMTTKEYFASFLYWSGNTERAYFSRFLLHTMFDEKDYAMLRRDNPDGYYQRGMAGFSLEKQGVEGDEKDEALCDEKQIGGGVGSLLTHPFRHLLVTVPMMWRGMQVSKVPLFGVALFCLFFLLAAAAVLRRQWALFALLVPAIFSFFMHSLLTHNITRYSMPVIPVLFIAAMIVLCQWSEKNKDRGVDNISDSFRRD